MSLMQLLAVGRSIGTIKDEPSPYKMTEQQLLPKFGAVKPPGRVDPAPAAPPAAPSAEAVWAAGPTAGADGTSMKTETVCANETVTVASTPTPPAGNRWSAWTLVRNPFRPASGRKGGVAPVQGELSLDMVRPVRNELHDTDLEMVPAGSPGRVKKPVRLGARSGVETAPSRWRRWLNWINRIRNRQS